MWQTAGMLSLRSNPYKALEKALGYRFRRRARLEEALTHSSFKAENEEVNVDYQRLEFLGDAALSLVCGAHLFNEFPEADEGGLTRMRSALTSQKALSQFARDLNLGPHVRLGRGELLSGGADRDALLEDVMEALLGAVYLDGGVKGVERVFQHCFARRVPDEENQGLEEDNPKGRLQELCQRRWKISPRYQHGTAAGPQHARLFTAEATIEGRVVGSGQGPNKKAAETAAAEDALKRLQRRRRRRRKSGGDGAAPESDFH